jgi:hypothetical protein
VIYPTINHASSIVTLARSSSCKTLQLHEACEVHRLTLCICTCTNAYSANNPPMPINIDVNANNSSIDVSPPSRGAAAESALEDAEAAIGTTVWLSDSLCAWAAAACML